MKAIAHIALSIFLLLPGLVAADDTMKKALAKAQFMLRQANAEKVKVQAQLSEARKESDSLAEQNKALEKDLGKANKKIDKLKNTLGIWKEKYGELKGMLGDTRTKLGESRRYGQLQTNKFTIQTENFDLCLANNQKLYEVNLELLDLYKNKSAFDAIKQREPITGLSQVQIENLSQDYRFKIEDLSLDLNKHQVQAVEPN